MLRHDVAVRPFCPADAPAVSTIIAITMRRSNSRDYPVDRLEALVDYFTPSKLQLLAAERECLVAVAEEGLVGTAARDGTELVTFFVLPEWQGRGVGTRLLEHLERNSRSAGIERLVVHASVTGAGFYERHGYGRADANLVGTAGPQVPMSKDLTEPLANER
jgi:GNAT superfamily N-acetyltransferase